MDAVERLKERIQSLPESAFVAHDELAAQGFPAEALGSNFQGLILGAPRSANVAAAVPALLLNATSKARSAALPLRRNAIAVATDCDRGTVYAAPAFQDDPSKSPGPPPAAVAPAAPAADRSAREQALRERLGDGNTAGTAWLDFRRLLHLPVQPARLALRVIYFDQVSNPAMVALDPKDAAAPAVSAEHALSLAKQAHDSTSRLGVAPGMQTPRLDAPGVALALGASTAKVRKQHLPVYGALKIAATYDMLVQRMIATQAQVKLPAAVVRATLMVVLKDHATPWLMPLEIPVWSEAELHPGDLLDAAFTLDLNEKLLEFAAPGTYQVYLLGSRFISGPHAFSLTAD